MKCSVFAHMERDPVFGTPDEVIRRLKISEGLRYDEYCFWIDSSMTFKRKNASSERFTRDVNPWA